MLRFINLLVNSVGSEETSVETFFKEKGCFVKKLQPKSDKKTILKLPNEEVIIIEAGIPDFVVLNKRGQALFVEVKSKSDSLSANQITWLIKNQNRYNILICQVVLKNQTTPKKTIIMGNKDGIPIIRSFYRPDVPMGSQFWCRYCKKLHRHGEGDGHREAHCLVDSTSPFLKTGYIIMRLNNA